MRLPSGITVPNMNDGQRERLRGLVTPMNLHLVIAALLLVVCGYLGVRLYMISGNTGDEGDQALLVQQSRVAAAEVSAAKLRGVDEKLQASDEAAHRFYTDRLPYAYSDVASAIGTMAKETNVRWSRASYVQGAPSNGVTELRIDGAVAGDYVSVAKFINALERSKTFFLVQNVALSGAQGGMVNLQLRVGTFIREPMPGFVATQSAGAQL